MNPEKEQQLLEELSHIEHEQWVLWVRHIMETQDIDQKTKDRWESYCIPYQQLPDGVAELDRVFARKSLEVFKKYIENNS